MHKGLDLVLPEGTRIYATHSGEVVDARADYAGIDKGYGLLINLVAHDRTTQTRYAHLSELKLRVGERVRPGDLIALSGMTGNASDPHLHWEVCIYRDDEWDPVDPYAWLENKEDPDVTAAS
jgi:murein DD-endopeptidase MepM/ murein hydrolase activator NlpD